MIEALVSPGRMNAAGVKMVRREIREGILWLCITNPPVNALGRAVREGLHAAVVEAQSDPAIRAIAISGAGKMFCGGADIAEFEADEFELPPRKVFDVIENSAKPVVAAINDTALGGGLELAMACHFRVAADNLQLGLPEVSLGLLPGAGGTQRLPRLIGPAAALEMIVGGKPISAQTALDLGLVDRVVTETGLAAASASLALAPVGLRRTGELPCTADEGLFDRFVAEKARSFGQLEAPVACVEAVQAATTLPFDQGLDREEQLFARLVAGTQSRALRHMFFAEREAPRIEGLPAGVATRGDAHVGIVGAGTMGGGIAMNFLSRGYAVTIVEAESAALARGVDQIRRNYAASAAKGRLSAVQVEAAMALLTPTLELGDLRDCDLVIEAIYENLDAKKDLFARLDAIVKPGAMLATNTSFLSVDEIAAATSRPADVFGLHFFSPANVMKLVEVVRGARTAIDVVATGMSLARSIGKVPVLAGVCHGFIGNRMLLPRQRNAEALLLEGATAQQVDAVHLAFGMPMGPFQMADLAGVDLGWHRDASRVESIPEALCAAGRWGQKTGGGFYDYDEKRKASPSPAAEEIIAGFRAQAGVLPRQVTEEEIRVRTMFTMVNEGAKILDEGIAQRASDIDVVWNYGYGWPRHTGGPMFWADELGAARIVDGLRTYQASLGEDFVLSRLLVECARSGRPLSRSIAKQAA